MTPKDYESLVNKLQHTKNQVCWDIGDTYNIGRELFGDEVEQYFDEMQLNYRTIQNYARVARQVAPARRVQGLSFKHHSVVAACNPNEQTRLLNEALNKGMNSTDFQSHVTGEKEAQRYKALGVRVQDVITALIQDYGLTEDTVIDFTAIVREELAA